MQVQSSLKAVAGHIKDSHQKSEQVFRTGLITSICIAGGVLVAAIAVTTIFTIYMTRPLLRLSALLDRIANMDLDNIHGFERSWLSEIAFMQVCVLP